MKKNSLLLCATLATSLIVGTTPMLTQAATTDTKDATATLNLKAPEDGTLKITNADNLDFGSATLSANTVYATTTGDTEITIQELSGTAPGWKLSAQLGDFKSGTKTLAGAQLFYPEVTPTTNAAEGTAAANALPVSVNSDDAFQGTVKGKIVSAGGNATTLISADSGKGYGQWTMPYSGDKKVQLKVPAGQLTGNYVATLTYTIVDTPTP